jgi:sulfur-oxidizing protein SoxY
MNDLRRIFLKGGSAAIIAPLLGAGLLAPSRVLASEWNRAAFAARNVADSLKALDLSNIGESRDILINAPEIAENGAKVEIEVSSNLPGSQIISVLADKNPFPLCASLRFSGNALPYTRMQMKLAETSRIRAIVKTADGKTYVAFREIKVTIGGCGG